MRKKYLQVYSGIAILFVVIIHGNAYYLHNILGLNRTVDAGKIFYFFDNLLRAAIPMFIFIAGYKYEMTKNNKTLRLFYKDKLTNIGKPFIIISLFFIIAILTGSIMKCILLKQSVDIILYVKIFTYNIIQVIIGYNEVYQLWYIPMYLLVVLSYPIICKYIKSNKNRMALFILITVIQQIGIIYFKWLGYHPFDYIYYFCLFELGSIFFTYRKNDNNLSNNIIWLYIIILTISASVEQEVMSGLYNKIFLNPIACMAFYRVSIILSDSKIFNCLGKYSFYIFLFHEPIFMKYIAISIYKMGLYTTCLPIPIVCGGGILMSIITYKVFMRFKVGRYILNR